MKKMISRLIVALMAGAFTFAASANEERYDSYAAYGTLTYNGTQLTNGWLRSAIVLGETGYNQVKLGGFSYEGATIKATSSGVVHHADSGTYPHFWCDMTYDVRGCTVIGASNYNKDKKIPYDSWIPTIYVTNHSGKASMRVTVLADEKTRLSKFEFFPETGAQIVCKQPVTIIRAEPGTTTPCDWEHGVTDYGVAWYYADPDSPAHEPVFKNDGMYYYSEVKPVSLKGSTYHPIFGTKTADYDYTVPHTSFVVMDNGKATPEWAGCDYYGATNEYYGTTKKFQIAYRAHTTTGIYTTDSGYYFLDGTTSRTVSINTAQDGYVNDLDTFKTFSTCYIPAEQVTDTPVPLIPTVSLDVPNTTCTIDGIQVKGKEDMVLSNGTYTVTYTANDGYCFTNCTTKQTATLDTSVSPAVIKAGEKPEKAIYPIATTVRTAYETLQAAVDATDGDMVTLVNDSTETVTLATDKYIGLDFNGHTLGKLVVTAGTVEIYAGSSGTLTSARVSQPGKVRCLKNDVVAVPTGYEWFNDDGGTFWMLVKTTEPYTGDVTIATNLTADATWVMTLESANITVDKVADTDTLAAITNNLAGITGTGKILLNAAGDAAKAYRDALRKLRTTEAKETLSIDCLSVEPTKDVVGDVTNLTAVVEASVEDPEAETTLVGAMKTDGDVLIEVKDDATKDVVVNEGAETSKNMTIKNLSTQSLTVPEAKAENVTITNYGHLESETTADNNLIITNSSANTLVGTYKAGGNIEVTGQYGSLSNVTFDAEGTLTLKRRNIISGPVTLKADEIDVHANSLFFSVQNNNTTLSIDFDQVKDSMVFYVLIDDNMASGNYPLAMNATAAATKTFGLKNAVNSPAFNMTVGGSSNPIYNKGSYAVVLDEGALKLTVDADYVAESLAALASMTNTATATIDAMRLLTTDKNDSKGKLGGIAYFAEIDINGANDTDTIAQALAATESNIETVLKAAADLEASYPGTITIDATLADPDGTNTFNTLDAAFKAPLTPCATNLVLTGGIVSLSADVPVDTLPDPATNCLQVITGSGYLLINKQRNDAEALAAAFQELVAEDATIKVLTAVPSWVNNNVTLTQDRASLTFITLGGTNTIAGDVELIAPTTTITGTISWDVSKDVSLLRNFDDLTSVDADYAIEIGKVAATPGVVTNRTIATNATKLSSETFKFYTTDADYYAELTVGDAGDVVYNGMVYTLAMTNGTDLVLTMDGDYVSEKLNEVLNDVGAAIAQVNAMRLTPSEKATAIDALNQIYSDVTTGVDAAKNKAGVAAAIASVGVEGAIAGVLAGAEALEATKPGDITIDATVASDGTNTFTSLDAAFNNTEFMPCATNLVLTGRTVGLSAGVFASPATNCLMMISGTGTIVIGKDHKDAAGNNDAEALEAFFNSIAGEGIKVTTGEQVVIATDMTPAGEVVAVESISLGGTTTISTNVVFTAPAVANNGTLKWDLTGDNHEATLADFDYIAEAAGAKFQIALDGDQATGSTITNYTIATGAASATNLTFTLEAPSPFGTTNLTVGADNTLYVGAKAFTLTVSEEGDLVFDVAWGKFAITFDAMGGTCTNGCETLTYDCKVNDGYTLPGKATREYYTFLGWYASWTNNAVKVSDGQDLVKLAEHTIYAQWAPDPSNPSTTKALSEFLDDGTPRYEIGTNSFKKTTITSLTTPLYLRDIRYGAFMYCKSLKTVRLTQPRDYTTLTNVPLHVETYAFAGSGVRSIVIPAGAVIDNYAFAACQYVTNITFLGTCTILGDNPFRQCGTVNDVSNHVVTVSLAPAAWVDEGFRQTLETKIANLTFVKLETEEIAGYLESGAPSVEGDQVSVPFTTNLDAMHAYVSALVTEDASDPWKAVTADSVEKTGKNAYRATFTLPGAWSKCILKLSIIE